MKDSNTIDDTLLIPVMETGGKLYHYTSATGLKGICEGSFWVTEHGFLNDSMEFQVATDVFDDRKVEHPIDGQWVAQHEECDAWLVLTSDTHASTVLAYYEREKPIYTNHPESGEANPFPNVYLAERFEAKDRIALMLETWADIPEWILKDYDVESREWVEDGDERKIGVYVMKRKS